jgi:hypothetical protein
VEPYQLFALGVPVSPEAASAVTSVFDRMRETLSGHLTGRRTFNFLGADDDPTAAFSDAALTRLAGVKAAVDPTGTFRSNRPVGRVGGGS